MVTDEYHLRFIVIITCMYLVAGIQNVVTLWCGVMTEQRVLFRSRSFSRLSEACRALTALMFPFKYAHVYIPLLPAALTEVLNTPTPFVMGVHASLEEEVEDLVRTLTCNSLLWLMYLLYLY